MRVRPLPKAQGPLRLPALRALNLYSTTDEHYDNDFKDILGFFDARPAGLRELAVNIQDLTGDDDGCDGDFDVDFDVDFGGNEPHGPDEPREPRNSASDFPVLLCPQLAALTKLTLQGCLPMNWPVSFPSFANALARHLPLLEEVVLHGLHVLKNDDVASLAVLPALRRLTIVEGGVGWWYLTPAVVQQRFASIPVVFSFEQGMVAW